LLDAVLGTGSKPPVREVYADAIARLKCQFVDGDCCGIPSGADADARGEQPSGAIARANADFTFTAPRPAHFVSN